MSEQKLVLNDQITPGLKLMGNAAHTATKRMVALDKAAEDAATRLERIKREEYESALKKYPTELENITKNNNLETLKGMAIGAGIGLIFGGPSAAFTGAWQGGLGSIALNGINQISPIDKAVDKVEAAREAYEKAKRPSTKAEEAGYYDWEERYRKLYERQQNGSRDMFLQSDLEGARKQMEKILTQSGATKADMLNRRWQGIYGIDDSLRLPEIIPWEEQGSSSDGENGPNGDAPRQETYRYLAQAPRMRGVEAVQPTADSSLRDADIWDLDPLTGKVDDFQKTTTDALKTVKGDLDLVNLNGWSLMRKNISDTSIKYNTDFISSSDSALSTVSTGLTAVNTGYGAVNTAATSLFNLTGTGFGNSLLASQNYQQSGLAPLALGFGTTLPTQLACSRPATTPPLTKRKEKPAPPTPRWAWQRTTSSTTWAFRPAMSWAAWSPAR